MDQLRTPPPSPASRAPRTPPPLTAPETTSFSTPSKPSYLDNLRERYHSLDIFKHEFIDFQRLQQYIESLTPSQKTEFNIFLQELVDNQFTASMARLFCVNPHDIHEVLHELEYYSVIHPNIMEAECLMSSAGVVKELLKVENNGVCFVKLIHPSYISFHKLSYLIEYFLSTETDTTSTRLDFHENLFTFQGIPRSLSDKSKNFLNLLIYLFQTKQTLNKIYLRNPGLFTTDRYQKFYHTLNFQTSSKNDRYFVTNLTPDAFNKVCDSLLLSMFSNMCQTTT